MRNQKMCETSYGKDELWNCINNYEWAYNDLEGVVQKGIDKGWEKRSIIRTVERHIYSMKDDFGRLPTTEKEREELATDFVEVALSGYSYDDKKRAWVKESLSKQMKEDTDKPYWYFTTHGVMPGSVPKNIEIVETRDGRNRKGTMGTFVALDRVLTTDELKRYDLIELAPETEAYKKSSKKRIKERAHNPVRVNKCRVKVTDIEYDIAKEDFDQELTDREFEKERRELIKTLPQSLILTLICDDDEYIDDIIADKISDETGWLVDTFKYEVISTNESMRRKTKRRMTEAYENENDVKFLVDFIDRDDFIADFELDETEVDLILELKTIDELEDLMHDYDSIYFKVKDAVGLPEIFSIDEFNIGEDDGLDGGTLETLREYLDMEYSDQEIVDALVREVGVRVEEAIDIVTRGSYWLINANSPVALAYEYIDSLGGISELGRDTIETYFDYEHYGKDLAYDFYDTDVGYISLD